MCAYYEVGGKLVFKTTEEAAADTATYTEAAKVATVEATAAPAATITIVDAAKAKVTKIQAGSGSGTFTTPTLTGVAAGTTIDLTGLTLAGTVTAGCTYVIDDDELTAQEGDTVTFASSATSAAKVTLTKDKAATVAGVTYTASAEGDTVDKDGKVTGSADLSVSAAEAIKNSRRGTMARLDGNGDLLVGVDNDVSYPMGFFPPTHFIAKSTRCQEITSFLP